MQLKLTVIISTVVVLATTAFAGPTEPYHICGNSGPVDASVERQIAQRVAASRAAKGGDSSRAAATIPVYWHTITDGSTGSIPSSGISNTINQLNAEYAGTGFSFRLAGSDSTSNSNWFRNVNQGTSAEASMKNALRKGGSESLNVYSVDFGSSGLLGYATFPWSYSSAPNNDGIVVQWNSYNGGSLANYNTGKTHVHEVGHWLGLYHVFQGGCSGSGDGVSDTPPQSAVTRGCPTGQDSCSGGGVDSITNHMDYSAESCRTTFTTGQITRMDQVTSQYRF